MRLALAFAFLVVPTAAFAQSTSSTPPRAAAASQPSTTAAPATPAANPREPTPYQRAITRGAEAFHNRQFDAAATAFREAAGLNARSAEPQVYLGTVALAQGNAANALGAFREAARIAQAEGDDRNRARALVGIAAVQESQQRWDDARNTWQEYTTFADGHAQVTYPNVPRARLEAIGRRATIDQEYAPVRERIAERQRINASGQNQQGPAGTTVAPVAPGSMPAGTLIPSRRGS